MAAEELLVDVHHLVKTFGPLRAVDDLTFQVRRGEIVGLLGPNGAGKSTTMKVLTCYLVADGGTAKVAGVSIDEDPVEVRRHIGYLPENAPLYNEMRVKECLAFVSRMRGLSGAEAKERMDWAVKACGLEAKYMSAVGTLSRGFRQRVGLAQAVLHDPDLLILDEPTSGLDPIQIIEIRKLIMEIGKTKTVLFSTHIMQEVDAVCNRAIIMNRGKLAADGAPSELKARLGKEQKIVARLKGPTALEVETLIGALDSVASVSVQNLPNDGWMECNVRLKAGGGGDDAMTTSERLYGMCKEKGWGVQEIRVEALSLEDAFLKATGHEKLK
ncbi:MAG: ATP-binding cassette domain-containing protein [Planctomycetota bacterium]|nr:ATP-binding cassette domain-containing protein [Planctomycetota bacterium]